MHGRRREGSSDERQDGRELAPSRRRSPWVGPGRRVLALAAVVAVGVVVSAGTATGQSDTTTSGSSTSGSSKAASTTGVTKDSITLSVSGPYSGVYGVIGKQTYSAVELWRDEVNAAGGIDGRKIKLVQVDNQFTPEGAVAGCKEVQTNGSFIDVNQIDSGDQVGCEDKAGIPVFATATGLPAKRVKAFKYATFGLGSPEHPPTEVSFLSSKYMDAKGKKIGLVVDQGPSFTAENDGLRKALKKQGYKVVDVETAAAGGNQTSFVTEMQRMQQSGAEVVVMNLSLEAPTVIRDAKSLGYTPEFYLGPLATLNILAQTQHAQYDGVKGTSFQTTTETPAYAAWVDKVRKAQGEAAAKTTTTTNASAYAFMDVLGHVLKAAGPNLTRESFVAAARSVDNYDRLHLISAFNTKGEALPIGEHDMFPVQCCNPDNTFKLLGPPEQTFPPAKSSASSK